MHYTQNRQAAFEAAARSRHVEAAVYVAEAPAPTRQYSLETAIALLALVTLWLTVSF